MAKVHIRYYRQDFAACGGASDVLTSDKNEVTCSRCRAWIYNNSEDVK